MPLDILKHQCSFTLKVQQLTPSFITIKNLSFQLLILKKKILNLRVVFVHMAVRLILYHFSAVYFSIQSGTQRTNGLLSLPDDSFSLKVMINGLTVLSPIFSLKQRSQPSYFLISTSYFPLTILNKKVVSDSLLL